MAVINSNRMNFEEVVNGYLKQYVGETAEGLTYVIPKVARQAAKKLRKESPKGATGDYARNWKVKVETGRIRVGATVYGDSPTYRLAHLLEHGHAKRGGGRTSAIIHIKPVEEWAIDESINQFIDYMERRTK